MAAGLLETRLRIPPLARHLVPRTRLVRDLEEAVSCHRLTLVMAPAGYGKSSLLSQWATARREPVAWVTVDPVDNDPGRFLRSLVVSWGLAVPSVRESAAYLLVSGMNPDPDDVIEALLEIESGIAFVLDDAHLILDDDLRTTLATLVERLPPRMRVVLAGRSLPFLPVARYRARGELAEFHASDLRFSLGETRAFLVGDKGLQVDHDSIARLDAAMEGWVAGLHLVSLSMRGGTPGEWVDIPTGRHRFIADYLREDVLTWLPVEAREFLLRTSILDQLCAPLCEAVTGQSDSQAMLEWLEQEQVFIEPLDVVREWYRYHPLFADVLRQELYRAHPADVAEVHRRAARWFLANNQSEEALAHALAGDDAETGVTVLDQYLPDLINTWQLGVARRWLDSVPPAWRDRHPEIRISEAAYLLVSGAMEEGMSRLEEMEARLQATAIDDTLRLTARVSAVRCFVSCFQKDLGNAEAFADRALAGLGGADAAYRADIHHALGDTYRHFGQWDAARASYQRVLETPRTHLAPYRDVHVYGALADLELMRGRLQSAKGYWDQARDAVEQPESLGLIQLPVIGWVHIRLGELFYEWNDLPAARDYAEAGVRSAAIGDDPRVRVAGATLMARLQLAVGDVEAAADTLEDVRTLVEKSVLQDVAARYDRCRIEVWLAQGAVGYALHSLETTLAVDEPLHRLAVARVLCAVVDDPSLERAERMLTGLLEVAADEGRLGLEIEAWATRALVSWQRSDVPRALIGIERALTLAKPEGYIRLFADLGPAMAPLLQEARTRHVLPDYLETIQRAIGKDVRLPGDRAVTLPEPLSPRELDVLRLIAAGLTNEDIGDRLFISPETVKKHASSIYGKLGAGNRTETAARARELGLLTDSQKHSLS